MLKKEFIMYGILIQVTPQVFNRIKTLAAPFSIIVPPRPQLKDKNEAYEFLLDHLVTVKHHCKRYNVFTDFSIDINNEVLVLFLTGSPLAHDISTPKAIDNLVSVLSFFAQVQPDDLGRQMVIRELSKVLLSFKQFID